MRRFQIIDHCCPPLFCSESTTPIFSPPFFHDDDLTCATLDLLHPHPCPPTFSLLDYHSPFETLPCCDAVPIETTPFCAYDRVLRRRFRFPELYLHDRVAALEWKLDRLVGTGDADRKYSWTAEIKGGAVERKCKMKAEIEGDDLKKGKRGERKYKWTTEIKGKDDQKRTYSWETTIDGGKKKGSCSTRIVEIEEPSDCRALALRQKKAFAKRALTAKDKGKRNELSAHEAAAMIQLTYRGYAARRSQTLGDLRELAVARSKLKELRILFHNFSYRSQIVHDAEERQKFSEKIIVLLLTVDAIKGVDHMVKAAKGSMVHELEAMLDWVDPQRSLHKTRTFDMPIGGIQRGLAESVAKLVELVDQ